MKIIQVAAPTAAGGLERVVESLSIGLHDRGHDVTVATLLFDGGKRHPFVETLQSAGVSVHALRLRARDYVRERRELKRLLRAIDPDVVHTHGYRIDLLDRPVAASLGIPTVTTVHGASKTGGIKGAFFEWLQRRNYRRFDAVVAVSSALHAESLADGVALERLHLIPNAWGGQRLPMSREAAREELGLADDAVVLGWVGRLIPVKGCDVFLRALHAMPEPRPTAVIVGYGPELTALERLVTEHGLEGSVRFYPEIRDAARYFKAFDTFVLSSRSEGLPIVLLEAMAADTPIVASRVGGVPEAVTESDAYLVESDDPEALAEAIAGSLRDRAAARGRAHSAGKRLRSRFALDTFVDGYERVYRGVTGVGTG